MASMYNKLEPRIRNQQEYYYQKNTQTNVNSTNEETDVVFVQCHFVLSRFILYMRTFTDIFSYCTGRTKSLNR